MAVILIRRRNDYEAGELDPETGDLRLIAREFREPPGAAFAARTKDTDGIGLPRAV